MIKLVNLVSVVFILVVVTNTLIDSGLKVFAQTEPGPYISEINYAGSINDANCKKSANAKITCANDKWIEIYNPTSHSIKLSNWKLGVGRRSDNPDKFSSMLSMPDDIELLPNQYIVFLNSNVLMESSLDKARIEYHTIGSLFAMSNNTPGAKYIRVGLIRDDQVVNEINITNIESLEKINQVTQNGGVKHSLYFSGGGSGGSFSVNTSYLTDNYGTPGRENVFIEQGQHSSASKPISQPIPVVSQINPTVQIANPNKATNLNKINSKVENTQTKTNLQLNPINNTEIKIESKTQNKNTSLTNTEIITKTNLNTNTETHTGAEIKNGLTESPTKTNNTYYIHKQNTKTNSDSDKNVQTKTNLRLNGRSEFKNAQYLYALSIIILFVRLLESRYFSCNKEIKNLNFSQQQGVLVADVNLLLPDIDLPSVSGSSILDKKTLFTV